MKKNFFLFVIFLFGISAKAQVVINGIIIDFAEEPIQFANVIQFTNDSVFISGCITDENGTFSMTKESHASLLKISFIGFRDKWLTLPNLQTDLGTIILEQDAVSLSEVTVSAGLPKVYIKGDAQVTDVENSVLENVGSGNDVLKRIPGMVMKDGSLEVFGKGTPLIYINGKQMRDNSELEQLSSADIQRVELVSNPGAKYDATVGAVVRIFTKKNPDDGFGLDLRSSVYQSINTDLRDVLKLSYRHKGLDVFGMIDYRLVNEETTIEIGQINEVLGQQWVQKTLSEGSDRYKSVKGQVEVDYNINENHLFGVRYDFSRPDDLGKGNILSDVLHNGQYYDHLESYQEMSYDYNSRHQINGFYTGKVKESTIDFNFDYLYDKNKMIANGYELSETEEKRNINYENPVLNKLFAAKLTIGNPLFGGTLSYGGETTFSSRQDDFLSLSDVMGTSLSMIKDENIAVFAEYNRLFSIGMFTLGGRFEHIKYDYYVDNEFVAEQSKKYNHFYPNFSFATQIKDLQLMFSYAMKTERPYYFALRNSTTYVNRFTLRTGNPYLEPCTMHDFSLASSWKVFQFVVNYQHNINYTLSEWGEPLEEDPSIILIRPVNIDKLPMLSAYLTASPTIGIWNPNLTIGIRNKQWFEVQSQGKTLELNKPMFVASLNNVLTFPKNWSAYIDLAYYSKGQVENMYFTRGQFMCGLMAMKTFFNDSFSVALGVSDLFNQQRNVYEKYHISMIEHQDGKSDSREVYLTLRYRLRPKSTKYNNSMAGESEMQRM